MTGSDRNSKGTDEVFREMFAGFAGRHQQVFQAYEDLADGTKTPNALPQTLKVLWFEHCVSQDRFNADDRKIVDFMKKSIKNIPVLELQSEEKQVLKDLLARSHNATHDYEV